MKESQGQLCHVAHHIEVVCSFEGGLTVISEPLQYPPSWEAWKARETPLTCMFSPHGEMEIKKGKGTLLSSLLSLPGSKDGGEEDLLSAEDRLSQLGRACICEDLF